jgi:hypothetical protein
MSQPYPRLPRIGTLQPLPDDSPGATRETLKLMAGIVKAAKLSIPVRDLAISLTNSLPQKDYAGEIRRIFSFVQNNIRYVRDIDGYETLQTPEKTLEIGAGDCDDKSTLLAALLAVIGAPTRFVAIGFKPEEFHHVFVEVKLGPNWFGLDATENKPAGWSPLNGPIPIRSRMYWHIK